jgi:hypothetical protein
VQKIAFPAVLYGCESWTLMMKADKRKLDAFELWTAQNTMDSKKDESVGD